jgi:prepilin-type N-terminal cleavage/methylation domain-containing protein
MFIKPKSYIWLGGAIRRAAVFGGSSNITPLTSIPSLGSGQVEFGGARFLSARRKSSAGSRSLRHAGWTLVEMMVAVGIFSIASLALATLFLFSIRSFAVISNYSVLDQQNRHAMDLITKEIRQATEVTSYSTDPPSISFKDGDGNPVTYSFSAQTREMLRTAGGQSQVLLTNCNLLNFQLYQRNPNTGFTLYDIANNNVTKYVKVVELTWKTSKTLGGTPRINSENIQTARIVIRKQQQD